MKNLKLINIIVNVIIFIIAVFVGQMIMPDEGITTILIQAAVFLGLNFVTGKFIFKGANNDKFNGLFE